MKDKKKVLGLLAGLAVFALICALPLDGLSCEGRLCLALTLMTVVWWAAQVAQAGYISGIYLVLLCLLRVAKPDVVFSGWTSSTIWLVLGAYLIAAAVRKSGLGERLSYAFILRFVKGWKSIIVSVFCLTLVLSLLIPHPWPRAFLILSVMVVIVRAADLPKREATILGFTVFAASVPVSLIFLTGDATINALAASYADTPLSFLDWLVVMAPPAAVLSVLTLALILWRFKPTVSIQIPMESVRAAQRGLGKMRGKEVRTLVWVLIAVALWLTNGLTGLDVGWTALAVAMCMSLPLIGEVLEADDWKEVPVQVMVFLSAAIAIGKVGADTGMNAWIASVLLPQSAGGPLLLTVLLIFVLSVVIHMVLGSVIAVMAIAMPMFLAFAQSAGIAPIMVIGTVYLSVAGHYILPFHHLNMLVGLGEQAGGYSQRETAKLGLPLLAAVLISVVFGVGWWQLTGLSP